jgi:hypothetical protein
MKIHLISAAGVTLLLGAAWWAYRSPADVKEPASVENKSSEAVRPPVVQPESPEKPVSATVVPLEEAPVSLPEPKELPQKSVVEFTAPLAIPMPEQVPAPVVTAVAEIPVPAPIVTTPEPDKMQQMWSDAEFNGFAALDLAQQVRGIERIGLIRHGIELITQSDPDTAVEVANSLTEEHDHGVAVGTIVRLVAESSPKEAAKILFTRVPAETALGLLNYPRTAEVMQGVLRAQIRQDTATAMAWAERMPESSRSSAMETVAKAWARESPEAAAEWAASITETNTRETALNAIRRTVEGEANQPAAGWTNSISDPGLRAKTRDMIPDVKSAPAPTAATAQ